MHRVVAGGFIREFGHGCVSDAATAGLTEQIEDGCLLRRPYRQRPGKPAVRSACIGYEYVLYRVRHSAERAGRWRDRAFFKSNEGFQLQIKSSREFHCASRKLRTFRNVKCGPIGKPC